jgi:hypothetical protein
MKRKLTLMTSDKQESRGVSQLQRQDCPSTDETYLVVRRQ